MLHWYNQSYYHFHINLINWLLKEKFEKLFRIRFRSEDQTVDPSKIDPFWFLEQEYHIGLNVLYPSLLCILQNGLKYVYMMMDESKIQIWVVIKLNNIK